MDGYKLFYLFFLTIKKLLAIALQYLKQQTVLVHKFLTDENTRINMILTSHCAYRFYSNYYSNSVSS